eukprot:TRINITY_DN6556_c0_g2_i6.p1 TRINITY_DN6556_c0_g2~~TRINITY_DN6556_c0_g2_i6.p1  ORF type:complete len:592 (+),score=120.61 TRINITY_DN6556_c0_g2_i6:52-1827(+)
MQRNSRASNCNDGGSDSLSTPPRKLSKPPAFKQNYSTRALLKAFTVWALFSLGGWLAIPVEWLPLAAHCVGFGYYLLMIYGKARWLLPIMFGAMAFAGTAYLTIPSELYVYASHTFMYSVMTIVLVITLISVMAGARRARKEYQEFVKDLLQRRNEGRLQPDSRLSDSSGSETPVRILNDSIVISDEPIAAPQEINPTLLLEEELREAQESQKNLEAALLRALDDLKTEKDVRMNLEFSRHRLEEQLNREREARKASESAYQRLEESQRIAQRQAEQELKHEMKSRTRSEKTLENLAKEVALKETSFAKQEKVLQGQLHDMNALLEAREKQVKVLQKELGEIQKQSQENGAIYLAIRQVAMQVLQGASNDNEVPVKESKKQIAFDQSVEKDIRMIVQSLINESIYDCHYCKKRFGAHAHYTGNWVCGTCESGWLKKLEGVQGHIDQYNQEVQKVVSLRDEITLLQKGLQAEKNKVLVLQKQLLESNARASSLDESLNIQLREVLKTRNALDKMEKMYKNLCGVGLADLDEKVLHELEATHLEALKLTQVKHTSNIPSILINMTTSSCQFGKKKKGLNWYDESLLLLVGLLL